jgi:hypothetical protein
VRRPDRHNNAAAFDVRKEELMNDDASPHEDDIRRTEALFRFGAALPARDGFEHDLYQEWHARDAGRPGFAIFGCSPHLRGLTLGQLRQLAEADAQERANERGEAVAEPRPESQWKLDPELEARS